MKLFKILLALVPAVCCTACSEIDELIDTNTEASRNTDITLVADDFRWADASRTYFEETIDGVAFKWSNGDTIAIYPDNGDVVSFAILAGQESNTASFDGGGWALKNGHSYKAFYPFAWKNRSANAIEIGYSSQKGTKEGIGNNDWMYTPAVTPNDNNLSFHFEHIGALAKLILKVPTPGTYTGLTLTTKNGTTFPVTEKVSLSGATPAITPTVQATTITLTEPFTTTTADESKAFYFMMPAVDLSAETFVVTSTPAGINTEVPGKNFVAGTAYRLKEASTLHLMVLSDPHVLLQAQVGTAAFHAADSKLGEYSQELFNQAINQIAASKPDVLLVPGDMAFNGQKASHLYVADKLHQLRAQGIKVYVVPGNHDLDDASVSFDYATGAATPVLSSSEFFSTYHINSSDMPELAATNGLNYMVYPDSKLAILCLNSTLSNASGHKSAGGLTESTLSWAEAQAAVAQATGRSVILMMHHPVAAHFDTQTSYDQEHVSNVSTELNTPTLADLQQRLAAAGIHLAFTGHFHVMSTVTVSTTSGQLMDVCSPALCGYGAVIREASFNPSTHAVTLSATPLQATASTAINSISARQDLASQRMRNSTRAMLTRIANKLGASVSATTATKITDAFTSDEAVTCYNKLFCALAAGDEQTLATEKAACITYTNTMFAGLTAGESFMTVMILNVAKNALTDIINSIYDNTTDGTFVADAVNNITL